MRNSGLPFTIDSVTSDKAIVQPMRLRTLESGDRGLLNEAWLQRLLHENAELIPSGDIEPMFDRLIPVCMELPTTSGYVDNLMITPEGGLAIIEVKLWRNPQARREVVAQALDYAKAMSQLSFSELDRAVRTARKDTTTSLYDLVSDDPDALDEARFIDAVSRNLRRGRFLLIVIGDGIREEAADLIEHLQGLLTQQFTFAFVEIRFWEGEDGRIVALPTVPFKTQIVERGVLRIEGDGKVEISAPAYNAIGEKERSRTLTETEFFEQIAKNDTKILERFLTFKASAIDQGITFTFAKTMTPRGQTADGTDINYGSVYPFNGFDTSRANWAVGGLDAWDIVEEYHTRIATLVNGGSVKRTFKRTGWYVVCAEGKLPPFGELLLNPDRFVEILVWYAQALSVRAASSSLRS